MDKHRIRKQEDKEHSRKYEGLMQEKIFVAETLTEG